MSPRDRVRYHGDPPANRPGGGKRRKAKDRKIDPIKGNPAVTRSTVVAVLALLTSLGVGWAADVDPDVVVAVVSGLAFLAPIVAGLWTRFAVTPNLKVISRTTTEGEVVTGPAADLPVGTILDSDVRPPVRPELVRDPAHAMSDGEYVEDEGDPDLGVF